MNRSAFRQVLECAGTRLRCASTQPGELQLAAPKPEAKAGAQRRRRFRTQSQSGVALRLPPQSKKPERGQPCPRETKSRHSRTKLSALLFIVAAITTASVLLLCPLSAHAQGGVPLWTNRYEAGPAGGIGIAVDNAGNVFVTGHSLDSTNEDYVTIKYSNSGLPLWTNRYHGPGNGGSRPAAIAVDASGKAFVTGFTRSANVDYDFLTLAYSGAGVPLWTNRYDGPGNNYDSASAIAVDNNGNVFVTGSSRSGSDSLSHDYATIAYSNAGVPLWTNRYDAANTIDVAVGIAVDKSGNVFVTGYSDNGSALANGSSIDFATVAYSNAGVPLWINRYDGPANFGDSATAIAVDGSGNGGNVFVTGLSYNPNADYATIAYSNSGVPLWTNRYNGGATSRAIAVDNSGNVFVTGSWATVAYSSTGVKLWARLYTAVSYDPFAIAVDSSGNVFVTGQTSTGGLFTGGRTIAYSNSGVPLWTKSIANVGLFSMAVDRAGNVFVNGSSSDGTNSYIVTIKYSSSIPLPRLDFQTLNNELVLSWTDAGFNLQTAPAVTGPFTNILGATSPYTNVTTSAQQFFRLRGD